MGVVSEWNKKLVLCLVKHLFTLILNIMTFFSFHFIVLLYLFYGTLKKNNLKNELKLGFLSTCILQILNGSAYCMHVMLLIPLQHLYISTNYICDTRLCYNSLLICWMWHSAAWFTLLIFLHDITIWKQSRHTISYFCKCLFLPGCVQVPVFSVFPARQLMINWYKKWAIKKKNTCHKADIVSYTLVLLVSSECLSSLLG